MAENCWEFKKCGREPGGENADELGICPAAEEATLDGINSGKNGGRACWVLRGTLCEGKTQDGFTDKLETCMNCAFHNKVAAEEAGDLKSSQEIYDILQNTPGTPEPQ